MTPEEYKAKRERKAEYFGMKADQARAESDAAYNKAKRIGDMIPLGQPILVGHHSEGRHRADIKRIRSGYSKAFEASEKAKHYERKANNEQDSSVISSDDPEAVIKLKAKIAGEEAAHKKMVDANRLIRKGDNAGLVALLGQTMADEAMKPDFCGRIGFAAYQLSNSSGNLKRMKERLAVLEAKPTEDKEYEINGVRIVENADINRIQLFYDGKPPESVRAGLKADGFRWSPTAGAWQRQLNSNGRYAAKRAAERGQV